MESNVEDQNTPAAAEEPKAPRRRASRRVSAAAGATTEAAAVVAIEGAPAPVEAAQTVEAAPAAETAAAPAEAALAPAEAAAPAEEAPKKRATRSRKKAVEADAPEAEAPAATEAAPEAAAVDTAAAEAPAAEEAPKKRATRSRKKVVEPEAPAADEAEAAPAAAKSAAKSAPAADATVPAAESAEAEAPAEPVKRATRSRRAKAEPAAAEASAPTEAEPAAAAEAPAATEAPVPDTAATESTDSGSAQNGAKQDGETGDGEKPSTRSRRARSRGAKSETAESAETADQDTEGAESGRGRGQSQNGDKNRQNGQNGQNGDKGGQGGQNGPSGQNAADNSSRSSRTRQRDRKRRGTGDDFEPEITEDDVLLPIAGILDVLDNYAFVRTSGYLPGTSDVYVSLGQVKKYGLRRGDAVVGAIRQPRDGESGSRQKYNAIVKIDAVNGRTLEESEQRADAADLTAIYPDTRLRLEGTPDSVLGRSIDLVAPIGLGQRGVIVLPARTAGTPILSELAEAVRANVPDAHLMMVLADAQPEDVTHLERTVRGEVVAATFDRPAEDQATVAELAIERAKRMLELGHDVVVLMDSLNRFARAYAQAQHGQARPAHDEIDEFALGQIMKLLAAARNVENGGSLTILATVQHGTGLPADQTLLREARRVANSEIRIGKARAGVAPTVHLAKSRTATAAALLSADEASVLGLIRAELHDDDAQEKLIERIRKTDSNAALLAEVQRAGGLS